MKELSIVFPPLLTDEEQQLKSLHDKLRQIRKLLFGKNVPVAVREEPKVEKKAAPTAVKRTTELAQATEEARKKIASGMIKVKKSDEKSSFKRIKVGQRLHSSDSQGEPGELLSPTMLSPTLGSPTSQSPWSSGDRSRDDNRSKIINVRGYDLQAETLDHAFKKFGPIEKVNVDDRQKSAQITYKYIESAEEAVDEMDGNMVNGITIRVSYARRHVERPRPPPPPPLKKESERAPRYGGDRQANRFGGGGESSKSEEKKERKRPYATESKRERSDSTTSSGTVDSQSAKEDGRQLVSYSDNDCFA